MVLDMLPNRRDLVLEAPNHKRLIFIPYESKNSTLTTPRKSGKADPKPQIIDFHCDEGLPRRRNPGLGPPTPETTDFPSH